MNFVFNQDPEDSSSSSVSAHPLLNRTQRRYTLDESNTNGDTAIPNPAETPMSVPSSPPPSYMSLQQSEPSQPPLPPPPVSQLSSTSSASMSFGLPSYSSSQAADYR